MLMKLGFKKLKVLKGIIVGGTMVLSCAGRRDQLVHIPQLEV
jgi:hypothetical protein